MRCPRFFAGGNLGVKTLFGICEEIYSKFQKFATGKKFTNTKFSNCGEEFVSRRNLSQATKFREWHESKFVKFEIFAEEYLWFRKVSRVVRNGICDVEDFLRKKVYDLEKFYE